MGAGTDRGANDDDPFAALRAAGLFDEAPQEPSAEERARAAARRAREADLRRRLAEEVEHERRLEQRDQKQRRRTGTTAWSVGTSRYRNVIAPVVLVVVLGAIGVRYLQGGSDALVAIVQPTVPRPADYPPVDESATETPLGTPPPPPASPGAFEFIATQRGSDTPVAWDPCRPIRYVVNSTGAPPGTDVLLQEAIDRTAAATGLSFVNKGPTDESWSKEREPYQPERYGETWAPALIAWSTDSEVPALAGYIAGLGGATARSVPDDPEGTLGFVSGAVLLDSEDLGLALTQPGGADAVRAVIQHEVGHMVGLDHVADETQLMFSESTAGDWGTGDLAGLHALGSGPCLPDL